MIILPHEEERLFEQLRSWSRIIAKNHLQEQIDITLDTDSPIPIFFRKTEVIISYKKGEADEFAKKLFHQLGRSGLFTPRLDQYDLGAGLWLKQLESLLQDAGAMVAIITPGYESGNISALEADWGIVKSREEEGFVLVPAPLASTPSGFLKAFSWVDFRDFYNNPTDAIFENSFSRLVDYLLRINRNPYE